MVRGSDLMVPRGVSSRRRILAQKGQVGALADGGDDQIAGDLHEFAVLVEGGGEAPVIVEHAGAGFEVKALGFAVFDLDALHAPAVDEDDALLLGFLDLPGAGRLLLGRLPASPWSPLRAPLRTAVRAASMATLPAAHNHHGLAFGHFPPPRLAAFR